MKNYWKQISTLLLIASVLPELFSGNNPVTEFIFNPIFVFWSICLAYGIPVLLIRELMVRKNLGLPSLFLLGLAYGFFNEGVLAKTLIMNQGSPVGSYDGMVAWLGINWALTGFIVIWHALASVIAPIFLTHAFFPQTANQSWLLLKTQKIWFAVLVLVSLVLYVIYRPENTSPTQDLIAPFIAILVSMLILILISFRLARYIHLIESRVRATTAMSCGFLFNAIHLIGGGLLAEGTQNTGLVLIFDAILIVVMFSIIIKLKLNTNTNVTLFILGHYIFISFGVIFWASNPIVAVTNTLGIAGMLFFSVFLRLKNKAPELN